MGVTDSTHDGEVGLQALWMPSPVNDELRRFRRQMGYSLREMSLQLHVSKSYVKKLLRRRNPWAVRPGVEKRFRELQLSAVPPVKIRKVHDVVIVSRFAVPSHVRLLSKPRRCRGHNRWMIFNSPTQVYCNKECERLWRREVRAMSKSKKTERSKSHVSRVNVRSS